MLASGIHEASTIPMPSHTHEELNLLLCNLYFPLVGDSGLDEVSARAVG